MFDGNSSHMIVGPRCCYKMTLALQIRDETKQAIVDDVISNYDRIRKSAKAFENPQSIFTLQYLTGNLAHFPGQVYVFYFGSGGVDRLRAYLYEEDSKIDEIIEYLRENRRSCAQLRNHKFVRYVKVTESFPRIDSALLEY